MQPDKMYIRYAPEVKNYVRRIYSDGKWARIVRELVKYEVH